MSGEKDGLKRVYARIPEELARRWRVALAREGATAQETIERLVTRYVERSEEGARS